MLRGGARSIQVPIHTWSDVLGAILVGLLLFLLVRWVLGANPFHDLAAFLNPPPVSTLLRIRIGFAGSLPEALAAGLPLSEKAVRSEALAQAQWACARLLEERAGWRDGGVNRAIVKETEASLAWQAAWREASEQPAEGEAAAVILVVLAAGRSLQPSKQPSLDAAAWLLDQVRRLDPGTIAAFGAAAALPRAAGEPTAGVVQRPSTV
jgi:hypothetical protein